MLPGVLEPLLAPLSELARRAASGDGLDRNAAQQAAQHELDKQAYQSAKPSLVYRLLRYVYDKIEHALSNATAVVPGGTLGLVVVLIVLVLIVGLIVLRIRPAGRTAVDLGLFESGATLSADQHRALAEKAAAAGSWGEAVRERLRAVARELESRGVVDPRPGRTADELARDAGHAVPSIAEPLLRGVKRFDEVWYGGRTADAASYAELVQVDTIVREARLAASR